MDDHPVHAHAGPRDARADQPDVLHVRPLPARAAQAGLLRLRGLVRPPRHHVLPLRQRRRAVRLAGRGGRGHQARRVASPARDPVLPGRHRGHPHPRDLHRADHRLPHPAGEQDRTVQHVRRRVRGGRRRRCEVTTTDPTSNGRNFRPVFVRAGRGGWGRGLELTPTPDKYKVISVTGGGIHPVAQRIAELSGGEAVDGVRTKVEDAETLAAVINCGGTARIGVYPRKRIPTVDVFPGEPGGPLAQFITEDIFVSAVGTGDVSLLEGQTVGAGTAAGAATMAGAGGSAAAAGHWPITEEEAEEGGRNAGPLAPLPEEEAPSRAPKGFFVKFGTGVGFIINTFLAAARQSINLTLNTVLPFMAYVSLLLGFVIYTGIAEWIGGLLAPLSSNPIGLVVIGFVVALPFLSPILGPGAAVAQIVGVLMGTQIATGALPVQYALPTLFAIDGQVGCDFIPVGLGLGEAKAETVEVGTPAVLFSRTFTSPLAVVIAWLASFGL